MTSEAAGPYSVIPIGRVVSSVGEGDAMPIDGVSASIEVFPEYEAGLAGIESNTHLIILGWFHRADRQSLTLSRHGGRGRGVFGVRSPGRPNPIGLTSARVLGVEGRVVRLDRLDMIDGTPIVDIKRYSPGWDSIFSARTSRDTEHPGTGTGRRSCGTCFSRLRTFTGRGAWVRPSGRGWSTMRYITGASPRRSLR